MGLLWSLCFLIYFHNKTRNKDSKEDPLLAEISTLINMQNSVRRPDFINSPTNITPQQAADDPRAFVLDCTVNELEPPIHILAPGGDNANVGLNPQEQIPQEQIPQAQIPQAQIPQEQI
ncbi:hypothetical protein BGZ76_000566 [Entomortierella beljakovae]|nr:hypothetical protein BGZ76_000566 [Entomortierella beljakovae]